MRTHRGPPSRRILFDSFFLEKLFCPRENDFKIPIGRSERTRLAGHGGAQVPGAGGGRGERVGFNAENRVWRVRAGSPETTQRFQIADPISVHV